MVGHFLRTPSCQRRSQRKDKCSCASADRAGPGPPPRMEGVAGRTSIHEGQTSLCDTAVRARRTSLTRGYSCPAQ
eukprot:2041353-Pyramimonas_sp.AAC.1